MKNRAIIIKVLAALLALSLLFSFAGCKNGGETADVQKNIIEKEGDLWYHNIDITA